MFHILFPGSQGQNLALTVLYVPYSLDTSLRSPLSSLLLSLRPPPSLQLVFDVLRGTQREDGGEVSRGETMLESGTGPESYITEHTLVYENDVGLGTQRGDDEAGHTNAESSSSSLLLSSLELRDTTIYEP